MTDTLNLNGKLLDERISRWDFLAKLLICENHFMQSIPQHGAAIFEIFSFGDGAKTYQLSHIAGVYFGIFCRVVTMLL